LAITAGIALGVALTLMRLPRSTWDTLYAEDGREFLQAWVTSASPALLLTPYDGYLHLWPRILSGLVAFLPVGAWPMATIMVFGASVGLIGALSMIASRAVISSRLLRLLVLAVPMLLPFAGVEALGNLANLHWYFFYLAFWVCWSSPSSYGEALGWGAVLLVSVLTEIQLVFFAPVILFRAWRGTRHARTMLMGWMVGSAGQVLAYLASETTRTSRGLGDISSMWRGFLANVVLGTPIGHQPRVNRIVEVGGWLLPAMALLLLVISLAVAGVRSSRHGCIISAAAIIAFTSWSFSFLINNYRGLDYAGVPFPLIRWGTGASLLLWAALLTAADAVVLSHPRAKKIVPPAAAILLLMSTFLSPASVSARHGAPSWADQIIQARAQCEQADNAQTNVSVRHAPEGWSISLPCERLL